MSALALGLLLAAPLAVGLVVAMTVYVRAYRREDVR